MLMFLQLGAYLTEHESTLTNITLVLFSLQICKALVYLEGVNVVHRWVDRLKRFWMLCKCFCLFSSTPSLSDVVSHRTHVQACCVL